MERNVLKSISTESVEILCVECRNSTPRYIYLLEIGNKNNTNIFFPFLNEHTNIAVIVVLPHNDPQHQYQQKHTL